MNGNRTKYASTPTYGMQKRGLLKRPAPVRQAPEAPDFSQAPSPSMGAAFLPPMYQPPQSFAPAAANPPQNSYVPTAPYAQPPMQPQQIPFAVPPYTAPMIGMPLPPVQTFQQSPLMSQAYTAQQTPQAFQAPFQPRKQGFTPPQMPQAPVQPVPPSVQPVATNAPFGGFSAPTQPNAGYAPPVSQMPGFAPAAAQQPTAQPFVTQQTATAPKPPNTNKLWMVFLFGLLPLLFLPCLFLSSSWDILRYLFLALAIAGVGSMWYKQMYSPTARFLISGIYAAMCVATVVFLLQGNADLQKATPSTLAQPVAAQETPMPAQADLPVDLLNEPTPAPTYVGPSEAERRLELFMSLWQIGNVEEMVSLVQPSWGGQQENRSQALFNVLKNRTPEDFTIEDVGGTETDNSRTVTMRATINKNTGKAPSVYRFMVMMVKEGGEWYVNPNSLATNDTVETTDENVVNNRNQAGTATEPPRTTVTPPPPPETRLYYNNGANFYHMDPNCVSVKEEFLPFDNSFAYIDLKTTRRELNLSPCLKCNAPTDTLD